MSTRTYFPLSETNDSPPSYRKSDEQSEASLPQRQIRKLNFHRNLLLAPFLVTVGIITMGITLPLPLIWKSDAEDNLKAICTFLYVVLGLPMCTVGLTLTWKFATGRLRALHVLKKRIARRQGAEYGGEAAEEAGGQRLEDEVDELIWKTWT